MTVTAAEGYVVNTMLLSIDADGDGVGTAVDVECAIIGAVWNTGDTTVQWQTACPEGHGAGNVKGVQTLDVHYALDYSATTTLARVLDANYGKTADVSWTPDPENPTYVLTGSVILARGVRTHNVGALASAQASFPVIGAGFVAPLT